MSVQDQFVVSGAASLLPFPPFPLIRLFTTRLYPPLTFSEVFCRHVRSGESLAASCQACLGPLPDRWLSAHWVQSLYYRHSPQHTAVPLRVRLGGSTTAILLLQTACCILLGSLLQSPPACAVAC